MSQPRYACCLLWDGANHYLFEDRPLNGRPAAGRLTCFGGALEANESAAEAIHREIYEELAVRLAGPVVPIVELYVKNQWTARFFRAYLPRRSALVPEAQVQPCWLTLSDALRHPRCSPWHASAIEAWQAGAVSAQAN
jgi:8-oxo-dGTP pyrophosphatase MutT (NUDIX family)